MNDRNLRAKLVRLAHKNPELRKDLLPLIHQASDRTAAVPQHLRPKWTEHKNDFRQALQKVRSGMIEYQKVMLEIAEDKSLPQDINKLAERGLKTVRIDLDRWRAIEDDLWVMEMRFPLESD